MRRQPPAASAGRVLELVRSGQVRTRRALQEATGLSRSTLSLRLAELTAAGYLREVGTVPGMYGRPAAVLSFDPPDQLVLTADLGATHARFAVHDAVGEILAERAVELRIDAGPEPVLEAVDAEFRSLLDSIARRPGEVCGIGMGVPGPVDVATGRPNQPPMMPGWHDVAIADSLEPSFGVPVLVDNDANLMGLGEARRRFPDVSSLIFVKAGTGIGAGVVLAGQPVRGVAGGAGDIGHIRIAHPDAPRRCACGAIGCLAAHASGRAVARQLTERGVPAAGTRDVVRLVHEGNPEAIALVRAAGGLLGEVLATAVAVLNPAVLVVGGDLADTREHFMLGLRESLYQRTVPLATRDLSIVSSALGDRAGISGAFVLVVDHVFSADVVDARMAAATSVRRS